VALPSGWVIVGSLPTRKGTISGPGCLVVLDSHGAVRETFAGHGIDGPWDMTAVTGSRPYPTPRSVAATPVPAAP
jgi:hypothetical protein